MGCSRLLVVALLLCLSAVANEAAAADVPRWTFKDGTAGWQPVTQVKLFSENGLLVVVGTGNDPHFSAELKASSGWKLLRINAKFKGQLNGQVFWAETGKGGFSEERSTNYQTRSNGQVIKAIDIYFHADAELTAIRIDPHSGPCRLEVSSIELLNEEPPAPQSTPADQIRIAKDFRAELLYSVPTEQGSWVSLTTDPKGRLITSDQYGKLYRITVPAIGATGKTLVESIDVELGMAQGLCWAFDSLYVMVNGKGSGLYRVRDTDGDDRLDQVELLRAIRGGSEHGPHAVIPGPDGKSLYLCGGNHTDTPDPETSRAPRNWDEDHLLPRMWDAGGHAVGKLAPGGWVAKTDPDGRSFELVAIGFRNEYDLAFNSAGELFTYDADMEWDVGSPWYRPTRVNHVVSGAEFGWRSGTGKWPEYYPDSLGSVVDIGPGSPTGIAFGAGAKFPAKYQRALFICDWSYSVLYAVHLEEHGSTYKGTAERFASGVPLQLTDLVVNPTDGALYFTIGGRRTQSGLYRIVYTGSESTVAVSNDSASDLTELRRKIEALHEPGHADRLSFIWQNLSHPDRNIRYAARVALEFLPVADWQERVFEEQEPYCLIESAVALARNGKPDVQQKLVDSLGRLKWDTLSESQKLAMLRAYSLALIRLGDPSSAVRTEVLADLDMHFPTTSPAVNRELAQLLIRLNAPEIVGRTLKLLSDAPAQEDQIYYALCLRVQKDNWSLEQHNEYFNWFLKGASHRGGNSFAGFLANIRNEAIARLSATDKAALKTVLEAVPNPADVPVIEQRELVKQWTIKEVLPLVQTKLRKRDFERGRRMFSQAACFKCHRFDGQGGMVGPDLTGAGRRFNDLNLLESLIDPSKVISDQYEATSFYMQSGQTITGRIINLAGDNYLVSENMLDPGRLTPVNRNEIEEMAASKISQMPKGLLDTLTEDEILDLVAYLRSTGDPEHDVFK